MTDFFKAVTVFDHSILVALQRKRVSRPCTFPEFVNRTRENAERLSRKTDVDAIPREFKLPFALGKFT